MKPYLLRWLEKVENIQPGEALDLNRTSIAALLLKSALETKLIVDHDQVVSSKYLEKFYSAKLLVTVNTRLQAYNRTFFSKATIIFFNKMISRQMHEMLLQEIISRVPGNKTQEKEVMYEFMRRYEIEELVEFDTLKKANYRLRKSKKIVLFRQQNRRTAPSPITAKVSG